MTPMDALAGRDHDHDPIQQLLITGGWAHDFDRTAPCLSVNLASAGIATVTVDDLDEAAAALASRDFDLVTVYACWFTMQDSKYDDTRGRWGRTTPGALRDQITRHVDRGRGILAVHTAPICFDDWPRWGELLGGRWQWGQSWHPQPTDVVVEPLGSHPIVQDIAPFTVTDERYSALAVDDSVEILAWSDTEREPALWTNHVGSARVVVDTLGHDERSLTHPAHATMLRRCARWAAGLSDGDVVAMG